MRRRRKRFVAQRLDDAHELPRPLPTTHAGRQGEDQHYEGARPRLFAKLNASRSNVPQFALDIADLVVAAQFRARRGDRVVEATAELVDGPRSLMLTPLHTRPCAIASICSGVLPRLGDLADGR